MSVERVVGEITSFAALLTSLVVLWRTVRLGRAVEHNTEITQKVEILVNSRMSTALAKIAALEKALSDFRNPL